jgi:ADP-ribosylglycohydrolase
MTHGSREAVDCCRYWAALIVGALQGRSKAELVGDSYQLFNPTGNPHFWREAPLDAEVRKTVLGRRRTASFKAHAGFSALKAMEAALWCFWKGESFAETVLLAANLGEERCPRKCYARKLGAGTIASAKADLQGQRAFAADEA